MKKYVIFAISFLLIAVLALPSIAADSTISNLPDGGSTISGVDKTVIVQGGATKRATVA